MDDMLMGDSTIKPIENGWWLDLLTGNKIDPRGNVYNDHGDIVAHIKFDNDEE